MTKTEKQEFRSLDPDAPEIESGMSNFDHRIDSGCDEALRQNPCGAWAGHAAWGHYGKVWWDGRQFCEEVWVCHCPRETIRAATLRDLMEEVNYKYGAG